jgi:hypothetical protein
VVTPVGLVIEPYPPLPLGMRKQLPQDTSRATVDGGGCNERAIGFRRFLPAHNPLATTPSYQPSNIIIVDLRDELCCAEVVNQAAKVTPCAVGGGMVLTNFHPITVANRIEIKPDGRTFLFSNTFLRLFLLGFLYRFGFPAIRAFRRAVKPMTSALEVVLVVRRVLRLVDGHDGTFLLVS